MENVEHLKFPIGIFTDNPNITTPELQEAIVTLSNFPSWVEHIISNMDEQHLAQSYRPNGWSCTQVIHHCADSHMHCLMRLKFALTENNPTIMPYAEENWAIVADYNLPINNATTLLHCVHQRLVTIFNSLSDSDWNKTYFHPQYQQKFSLKTLLQLYAWHCKHHLAHLQIVKNRI
jgi:DinB superfamily